MPTYKHAVQLSAIPNCPGKELQPCPGSGFRFAFKDASDERNLLPVAILDPDRRFEGKAAKEHCPAYGLSMFQTLTQLKSRAQLALKTSPNFLKRVGDHYLEFKLLADDGRVTKPTSSGHFEFYEYAGITLSARIVKHDGLAP